jgi:hypothetical protein
MHYMIQLKVQTTFTDRGRGFKQVARNYLYPWAMTPMEHVCAWNQFLRSSSLERERGSLERERE